MLSEETIEKIIVKALAHMLRDREGIAVEVDKKMYTVFRSGDTLKCDTLKEDQLKCIITGDELKDGHMLWFHNEIVH